MKTIFFIIMLVLALLLFGCKEKTIYVPVESVKTECKDKFWRDSIYLQDSILIKSKGDTIWLEKYRFLYRDKLAQKKVTRYNE